jgi:hypothetical protein
MNKSKDRKLQRAYKHKYTRNQSGSGLVYVNGHKERRKPAKGAFGGKKK